MTNSYGSIAEFYDLVARQQSASSGQVLARLVRLLPESAAPLVEIGAGTGRVTRTLLAARSDLSVLAYEPSSQMRAILTSRMWAAPDARRRVTVLPDSAPGLELPPRILAAVIFGVAGHLDSSQRQELFGKLAERLLPGGFIAVELMGSVKPLAPTRTLSEQVGDLTYEWWISGTPIDEDTMHFANAWRVLHQGKVIREVIDEHRWQVLDAEQLAAESGLRVREEIRQDDAARVVVLQA